MKIETTDKGEEVVMSLFTEDEILLIAFLELITKERKKMYQMKKDAFNEKKQKYEFTEDEMNKLEYQNAYINKIIKTDEKLRRLLEKNQEDSK